VDSWAFLYSVVLLLGSALVLGSLSIRFGQSPIVGYLMAGMVLGTLGNNVFHHTAHQIELVSELGVALLLFSLGLEFSFGKLQAMGSKLLLSGVFQVVLTLLVTMVVCLGLGLHPVAAVTFGALVSFSSTACVLRILGERGEVDSPYGRSSLAILLVQDMAVVPLAILVTALAGGGSTEAIVDQIAWISVMALGLVALLYVAVNFIALRVLGCLTLEKNRELSIILSIVVGLGSAWAAKTMGISPALGAFIAGMFLGNSPFFTQVRADIAALRVILLTLFFAAAGMTANPVWMGQHWIPLLGFTVLLLAGKSVITAITIRAMGQSVANAIATGVALSQVGEFAFVLGSVAYSKGAISNTLYLAIVSATILTLLASPYLVAFAPKIGHALSRLLDNSHNSHDHHHTVNEPQTGIVFIGFGPAAQRIATVIDGHRHPVLVIDLNQDITPLAAKYGYQALVGDATHPDVLGHAHLHAARVVIITIPSFEAAKVILAQTQKIAPGAYIMMRSRYNIYNDVFQNMGAHCVFDDEAAVGERLSRHMDVWLTQQTLTVTESLASLPAHDTVIGA